MKNIIVLTHGAFAQGIVQSCEFLMGTLENIKCMSITLEDDFTDLANRLKDLIESFHNNYPTVIVTDIPGGSTTQIALKISEGKDNIFILTGLNLALLISLITANLTNNHEINLNLLKTVVHEGQMSLMLLSEDISDIDFINDDGEL